MEIKTYILPSHYACYLVNGDATGYTQKEIEEINEETKNFGYCIDANFDTTDFRIFNGLGCEVCEFTFVKN